MKGELKELVLADMRASRDATALQVERFDRDPKHCTSDAKSKVASGKTGEDARCGQPPLEGGWVCRRHGGKTPGVVAAAGKRVERANAEVAVRELALVVPEGMTAAQVLQESMLDAWALKEKLKRITAAKGDEVTQVDQGPGGSVKVSPETTHVMYADAIKTTASVARAKASSGVEQQQLELDQEQADLYVKWLLPKVSGLLGDLQLTEAQQQLLPGLAAKWLS